MEYNPNQPPYEQPEQPPSGQPNTHYTSPSYYEQPASAQPQQQPAYGQPPPYAQQGYAPPPYGQPGYGQPPYGQPPFVPQQQQPKKSLRWLWITLGIIGGLVVLSCAGCAIAGVVGVNFLKQNVGSAFVTGEYYQYLKQGNYSKAYALLDSSATLTVNGTSVPVDPQAFTTAAQTIDSQLGPITNFAVSTVSSDLTHLTVRVTRGGQSYDVHLTFISTGTNTKIASADGI